MQGKQLVEPESTGAGLLPVIHTLHDTERSRDHTRHLELEMDLPLALYHAQCIRE